MCFEWKGVDLTRKHFIVGDAWVDCIDTDDETEIAQRRQELAERYGVAVDAVRVVEANEVKYWK